MSTITIQKKITLFFFAITFFLINTKLVIAEESKPSDTDQQTALIKVSYKNPSAQMFSRLKGSTAYIGLLYAYAHLKENPALLNSLNQQLLPQNIAKKTLLTMVQWLLVTLIHEAGHALTAKLINNDPININVNLLEPVNGLTYFTFPLKRKALDLLEASAQQKTLTQEELNFLSSEDRIDKNKYIAILAAGPLCGFLTALMIEQQETKSAPSTFLSKIFDNPMLFQQLFQLFIPEAINPEKGILNDAGAIGKALFSDPLKHQQISLGIYVVLFYLHLLTTKNDHIATALAFAINVHTQGYWSIKV